MIGRIAASIALTLVLTLILLGPFSIMAQQQAAPAPCARSVAAQPAGTPDLDVVRCQVALDERRMGEMQSQLNAAIASLTLTQQDAQKALREKAAAEQRVKDWEAYARPLYAPPSAPSAQAKP